MHSYFGEFSTGWSGLREKQNERDGAFITFEGILDPLAYVAAAVHVVENDRRGRHSLREGPHNFQQFVTGHASIDQIATAVSNNGCFDLPVKLKTFATRAEAFKIKGFGHAKVRRKMPL